MARINQIQEALRQIEGGRFQTLANQYLHRRFSLGNCVHVGSNFGTDKTTKGVPDMYSIENGRFVFAAFTTSITDIRSKLLKDALDCLDETKTKIDSSLIERIILCHTKPSLEPSIAAEVMGLDSRIEIIGPEAMADDLNVKYPSLAHLTLGIPLGKGSFIDWENFIKRSSQGRFTTGQKGAFLYRTNEMANVIESISQNRAVLIFGQSGSGKTRIALEACREFSERNYWDFLVIDSRYSANVDDDVELILTESENLIILVDDANNNISLDHLLSVCAGNDGVKIVFTCRKMYSAELVAKLDSYLQHEDIELMPLAKDSIDVILENEYGITNRIFRERIASIANGNLRLAIMAAVSATEGDHTAIREPYDLLDFYMKSALDDFSVREQILAEVIAIYDSCDLVKGDPCYDRLQSMGYQKSEIQSFVSELNKREIVTTLLSSDNVMAIRMEEQNLRDFLICRHFAKENRSSFADFILASSDMPNSPYLKAAKSMVEVCGSASVVDYLRKECEKAWSLLENGSAPASNRFIIAFNQFLPIQALIYSSKLIDNADGADVADEILGSNMTSDGSVPLSVAISLMDMEDYFDTALQLFVKCIEKGSEKAAQYKWACGASNAFSQNMNRDGFDTEGKKLDALVSKFLESRSRNVAACLILLVDSYLSSRAEHVRQNGSSYTINALSYNSTPELAELHAHCFRALSALIGSEYEKRIKRTFCQQFSFYGALPEIEHAKNMQMVLVLIEDLLAIFLDDHSTSSLSCALCINQIYKSCKHEAPLDLEEYGQAVFDALGCENSVSYIDNVPKTTPQDLSFSRLEGALVELIKDYEADERRWESGQAFENVLLEIAKRNADAALHSYVNLIKSSAFQLPIPRAALDCMSDTLGVKALRSKLNSMLIADDYPVLFDHIDLLTIEAGPVDQELNEMLMRVEDGRCHLDLETLLKIELDHPGFALTYTTKLSECITDLSNIWWFFGNCEDESFAAALEPCFKTNPQPIVDLYLLALQGYSHFDYSLSLLRRLTHLDSSMPISLMKSVSKLDFHRKHEFLERLSVLWIERDESVWLLLKTFIDDALNNPLRRIEVSALIPAHNASVFESNIFWQRLESLIKENLERAENLGAISWAMSECDDATRARALALILTLDESGVSIGHLLLRRSSMSGSQESGFIPAKQREISVLHEIIKLLPPDIAYLEHKAWLSKEIGFIESDINKEKWELFHGRH